MELKNSHAIVTGASRGLGAAIAQALVSEGATVYGVGRDIKALNAIRQSLGDRFYAVRLDITDATAVMDWIHSTFSSHNFPDILINNAGAGSFGKIDEMDSSEWYKMINVNLNGLYVITSEVVKLMKQGQKGYIVNIGSILGTTTRAEGAAYSATKFGVRGFSESLFKEVRDDNIKVSCINPGSMETGFFQSSGIEAHSNMLRPKDVAQTVIHLLKSPENMLISEMTIRPLQAKPPGKEKN